VLDGAVRDERPEPELSVGSDLVDPRDVPQREQLRWADQSLVEEDREKRPSGDNRRVLSVLCAKRERLLE
jgi:hypothetical protein